MTMVFFRIVFFFEKEVLATLVSVTTYVRKNPVAKSMKIELKYIETLIHFFPIYPAIFFFKKQKWIGNLKNKMVYYSMKIKGSADLWK